VKFLSRIEEILLLAIWKLGDRAFGISIREQVESDTGVSWLSGAIYAPLNRLRKNGYVLTHQAEGPGELGGRPRIYYSLSPSGREQLMKVQKMNRAIWADIPDLNEES
jgi:DNA-binding PadR family transcriptional regulator